LGLILKVHVDAEAVLIADRRTHRGNVMSQFMICKSSNDLQKHGVRLCELPNDINKALFTAVSNTYFSHVSLEEIWIIEKIHDYCDEAQVSDSFANSKLYHLLKDLHIKSDVIVFWYTSDYIDLDVVSSSDELFSHVEHCLLNPCCVIYLLAQ
jgi:hypothetical protein